MKDCDKCGVLSIRGVVHHLWNCPKKVWKSQGNVPTTKGSASGRPKGQQ